MEARSDDKQVLSMKVLRIFIRPGWGMDLLTRQYLPVMVLLTQFHQTFRIRMEALGFAKLGIPAKPSEN
jgi:hypothetical protein